MYDELDMLSKRYNNLRALYDKAKEDGRSVEANKIMCEMDTVRENYLDLRNQIGWE